jgi:hypothetical protein
MTDTPDWNEESIDERLRALAAEHYHRPPPDGTVPRDAMWAAIAPAWQAERVVVALPRRGFRTLPWRWSAALAAGLIIGAVLDRGVESYLASSHGAAPGSLGTALRIPTNDGMPPAAPGTAAVTTKESPAERATTPQQRVAARVVDPERTGAPRGSDGEPFSGSPLATTAQTLYHAAAVQTLVQAEALLTTYRRAEAAGAGGEVYDRASMLQAARWARDVLSSTRLLIDSPAGRDPRLRALLTDLELVLAQIVQLSGAPLQAGERELIERAMRDRDLLPRLRSAVPAGATAS